MCSPLTEKSIYQIYSDETFKKKLRKSCCCFTIAVFVQVFGAVRVFYGILLVGALDPQLVFQSVRVAVVFGFVAHDGWWKFKESGVSLERHQAQSRKILHVQTNCLLVRRHIETYMYNNENMKMRLTPVSEHFVLNDTRVVVDDDFLYGHRRDHAKECSPNHICMRHRAFNHVKFYFTFVGAHGYYLYLQSL